METHSALLKISKGVKWPLADHTHAGRVMLNIYVSFLASKNKLLNKIPAAGKLIHLGAHVTSL